MHMQEYMKLLEDSFNPVAGEKVMCRDTVSVSWDGSMCAHSFPHSLLPCRLSCRVHLLHTVSTMHEASVARSDHQCTFCGGLDEYKASKYHSSTFNTL
jgi:hypothetical protein